MANRTMERRKNRTSFAVYGLVAFVILLIALVVYLQGREPRTQLAEYQKQEASLDEQIAAEEERAEENDQLEKYVQTLGYVEEEAQDKLNLVSEDKIIFVAE